MTPRPPLTDEHRQRLGASRLGIPYAEYRAHIDAGERWCWGCQAWQPIGDFGKRATAPDGLNKECRATNATKARVRMQRLRKQRHRQVTS